MWFLCSFFEWDKNRLHIYSILSYLQWQVQFQVETITHSLQGKILTCKSLKPSYFFKNEITSLKTEPCLPLVDALQMNNHSWNKKKHLVNEQFNMDLLSHRCRAVTVLYDPFGYKQNYTPKKTQLRLHPLRKSTVPRWRFNFQISFLWDIECSLS